MYSFYIVHVCLLVCVFLEHPAFLARLKLEPFSTPIISSWLLWIFGTWTTSAKNHNYYFPFCVVSPRRHSGWVFPAFTDTIQRFLSGWKHTVVSKKWTKKSFFTEAISSSHTVNTSWYIKYFFYWRAHPFIFEFEWINPLMVKMRPTIF